MELSNDIDLTVLALGTEYTDFGHGTFPIQGVNPPLVPPDTFAPPNTFVSPCASGQELIPPHGCVSQCTDEQLREFGYTQTPVYYPPHPRSEKQLRQYENTPDYKPKITIHCLEPPPIPPPKSLTIIEKRPQPHPPLPPIVIGGQRPEPPRTPSPLILRESPPQYSIDPQICYVQLPQPPRAPQQRIIHRWEPLPPKPRDIIIERWLPYKFLSKPKLKVIPAAPYIPQPVEDRIITHIPQPPHIIHQIGKESRPEDPNTYRERYGHTLLQQKDIERRLFEELFAQRASEDTLRRLRAIFRVPCDQNHESIGNYENQQNIFNNTSFFPTTEISSY